VFVRPQPPNCAQPIGFCTSPDVGQDSGDIVALLDVGYNFDGTQTPGIARKGDPAYSAASTVLSVPNFYGAHGHHASIPSMSASFYAAGPNIKTGVVVNQMHNIDVAPTIMQLLGVPFAPESMDGSPVSQILK
jgi:predicted AlkP superfamily phosphohydrolase/phosphomutase